MFKDINPHLKISEIELEILKHWEDNQIFEKSVKNREGQEKFIFYDGPPFANGLPHYGHMMQQALKDATTRYWTMKGYYVPRVNGWDCHGLPVEYEIEKELELSGRKDIEDYGVENFNNKCRESVFRYTSEWKQVMKRIARLVDYDNGYATLNNDYMESIWWVFKEIWDKGLIFESHKSMHVCPRCETTLSNFEVNLGYKDVTDFSTTAKFKVKDEDYSILAWTTTTWTLPGNVALAIGKDIEYVIVKYKDENLLLAKDLVEKTFGEEEYEIVREVKSEELVGKYYEPLFDYYQDLPEDKWKIFTADFVNTEEGTGIVHIASGYGEDDYNLSMENGLPLIQHVSIDGSFKEEVKEFAGKFCKGQDQNIANLLDQKGKLFKTVNYRHSYPHCWRCDSPLINYATEAWFVKVTEVKDQLIANNKKINWTPSHIQEGRFGKWLENVRDWNISRNRFWGCPIPIWECEGCDKKECISSVEELKEKSVGNKLPMRDGELDLHKPYIDKIELGCDCGTTMKRVPQVLDCWFESGAMPYAQMHYPFENKEEFEKNFPADFIAEAMDQTRGWFYTLNVLSTILFNQPAFHNVICTGILLAGDGEKLSKRKKNYPDPSELFATKGADSMRFYLYQSPVVVGESARFSDDHVDEILKKVTLTLWNTVSFFVTYAKIDNFEPQEGSGNSENKLDQWIVSELNSLIQDVTDSMERYNFPQATRPIMAFIDNLSNWYIRRSRRRFWKSENDNDKEQAYQTLYYVLTTLSKVMAPFMPFISDKIFRSLTNNESVHLEDYPKADESLINKGLIDEIALTRKVVNLGLAVRAKAKIKVRQPLSKAQIVLPTDIDKNILEPQLNNIIEELNIKEIQFITDPEKIAEKTVQPNAKILGPKYGNEVQKIFVAAKKGEFTINEDSTIEIAGFNLSPEELTISYQAKEGFDVESDKGTLVSLDTNITEELKQEGTSREVIRLIQDLRKTADYNVDDRIYVYANSEESAINDALTNFADKIKAETLAIELQQKGEFQWDQEGTYEIDGFKIKIAVRK